MKTKVVVTALVFAIVGFMLNPSAPLGQAVFGPPAETGATPTGGQTAALMVVAVIEAAAFGLGGALLVFGLPAFRRVVPPGHATRSWLAVSWALVAWVPHTALHRTIGHDIGKLVAVEYAFHVTLVLGAAILAAAFVTAANGGRSALAQG